MSTNLNKMVDLPQTIGLKELEFEEIFSSSKIELEKGCLRWVGQKTDNDRQNDGLTLTSRNR